MRKPNSIHKILSDPSFWPVHPDPTPVCMCECHQNKHIMHFMPCCDLSGHLYINEDGTLNHTKLAAAIVRCNPRVFGPLKNVMVLGEALL